MPGQGLETDWACIQSVSLDHPDPLGTYVDAVAAENGVGEVASAPVGWCSWYKYMKAVGRMDVDKNLACAAGLRDQVPLRVIQLDDGYQAPEAELLETNERFPGGLKPLSDGISGNGFIPGLWMAPFITSPRSQWPAGERRLYLGCALARLGCDSPRGDGTHAAPDPDRGA
jgi:hypothetical protein